MSGTLYFVTGADRKAGAIGKSQRFSAVTRAESAEKAIESVRADRYAMGRDHVHIAPIHDGSGLGCANVPCGARAVKGGE